MGALTESPKIDDRHHENEKIEIEHVHRKLDLVDLKIEDELSDMQEILLREGDKVAVTQNST